MTDPLSAEGLREFAERFAELSRLAHDVFTQGKQEVGDAVAAHLAIDTALLPSVGQSLPVVERPNLQLALTTMAEADPDTTVLGLSPEVAHFGNFSLSALLAGRFRGPSEIAPLTYDDLATGVEETLRCVQAGLWLLRLDGQPIVIAVAPGERHGPPEHNHVRVEVFAATEAVATAALERLTALRSDLNVYRGQVLGFTFSSYGEFGLEFIARPTTTADQVVLPPGDLAAIVRHAAGIGAYADQMRAAGQHLRRGLLLHGPPGTGKTHTVRHLMATMPERTTVVLQGPSVGALGQAAAIVRSLTPSMLVIEDVDLIAHERMMSPMGDNSLLFQLLNEMDGLTPTDDVLFVLTTNRRDLLEPALTARPGRIDRSTELPLPDANGRRRLLDLYLAPVDHQVTVHDTIVDATDTMTASFMRELVRRAVLTSLETTGEARIADEHLLAALAELDASTD